MIRADAFRLYASWIAALKVAATPVELIHEDRQTGFRLLRYKNGAETTADPMRLLLVPHIINRPYILDLNEVVSVVGFLCRQGIQVFMIDWGHPERMHRDISFAHYARYADLAVELMATDMPLVLGYCTGGIIAFIRASRLPGRPKALVPIRIRL